MSCSYADLRVSRWALCALGSVAIFLTGCGLQTTAMPGSSSAGNAAGVTVSGHVHGGNQPIAFATVQLFSAGSSNYGVAGTLYATTSTADDGAGSFSFVKGNAGDPLDGAGGNHYGCPTGGGDPLMYILATGGNTLNTHDIHTTNSASVFLAAVGRCSSISASTFIDMSEVTTVASLAALAQYFDPVSEGIGTGGTAQSFDIGLAGAFQSVSKLVDVASGRSKGPFTTTSGTVAGVTLTVNPESQKINLIANILASCVNNADSSASNCNTLFSNATPPQRANTTHPSGTPAEYPTATDVLQAAYYMLTNPNSSSQTAMTNLFNLAGGTGAPFQPELSSVPTDWTIGASYTTTDTCGTSSGGFLSNPSDIAVDAKGNVWVANAGPTANVVAIASNGKPSQCAFVGTGATNARISIDSNASDPNADTNLWLATDGSLNVYRYDTTSGSVLAFPTPVTPAGIAADDHGNVFFSSATGSNLYEVVAAGSTSTPVTPTQISNSLGTSPNRIYLDRNSAIWVSSGSTFLSRSVFTTDTSAPNFLNDFSTLSIATANPVQDFQLPNAVNSSYVSYDSNGTIATSELSFLDNFSEHSPWPTGPNDAGLNSPQMVAVDGAGDAWVANGANNTPSGQGSISYFSSTGAALSATDPNNGGIAKDPSYYSNAKVIAIDTSGNVWVAGAGNTVTEIFGAAVPVVTPFAYGIQIGRFQMVP